MDECRFDNLTRTFGAIRTRRSALTQLAGAGAALVALARADLGLAAEGDVSVEGCRLTGESCNRDTQCCSNECNRKRRKKSDRNERDGQGRREARGVCKCRGNGKSCNKDAACCRGRCDEREKRCRCIPANDICNRDEDCCSGRRCVGDGDLKFCKNR